MNSRTIRLRCAGKRSDDHQRAVNVANQGLQKVDDLQLAKIEPKVLRNVNPADTESFCQLKNSSVSPRGAHRQDAASDSIRFRR